MDDLETTLLPLWRAALQGDADSYRRFLQRLGSALRGFLHNRLRARPSEVEDLVQEVLLAVHAKRHTYLEGTPLTAWLHAIARYKWIDHLRHHARHAALHDDLADWEDALFANDEVQALHARRDLDALLALLPAKQRDCIARTRLHGESIAEVALAVGQSESAVKVQIHRGLQTLSRKLASRAV